MSIDNRILEYYNLVVDNRTYVRKNNMKQRLFLGNMYVTVKWSEEISSKIQIKRGEIICQVQIKHH